MKRYDFYLPLDLFERIKLLAKNSGLTTPKMMIHLLEVGYLKMLEVNSSSLKVPETKTLD